METLAVPVKVRAAPTLDEDEVWPPGFRFHPTDEELILYYLKRKMCRKRLKLSIVAEIDVYKFDPEELPGQSILKTGDRQWFFFSPRDRKYPNGARSNRATEHGYWKATGKDRNITCNSRSVGVKKTLVFYRGRAPSGERTDWVMHEYTLDEEELRRSENVKDYYALYKVFKKSGPGPKNGEQYGAPFREEDWADDEVPTNLAPIVKEIFSKQPIQSCSGHNSIDKSHLEPPLVGGVEFIPDRTNELVVYEPQVDDYNYTMPQVFGESENKSTLLDSTSREVVLPEALRVIPPSFHQNDEHSSFEFTQPTTSEWQTNESLEVTSASKHLEFTPQILEDFLEIDDLLFSEDTVPPGAQNTVDDIQYDELDAFHDAAMFLHDLGPIEDGNVLHPYMDDFGNGYVNQEYQFQANSNLNQVDPQLQLQSTIDQAGDRFGNGYVNQEYLFQANSNLNQVDPHLHIQSTIDQTGECFGNSYANQEYHFQANSNLNRVDHHLQYQSTTAQAGDQFQFQAVGNQMDYLSNFNAVGMHQMHSQLWADEQPSDAFHPEETNLDTLSTPTSGGKCDVNPDHGHKEGASGFSSALWSFVESIPTTPASAAESPLVNRAFERMSSFSRVRLNARNSIVSAGNVSETGRRRGGKRGFFFLSILGALCAILWVLIGTVRLVGRSISS